MMPLSDAPNSDTILKDQQAVQADVVEGQIVEAPVEVTEAGEAGGVGGLGKIIWRVFAENKLALISVGVIVFILLFCFVGPYIYPTNQTTLVVTSASQVL